MFLRIAADSKQLLSSVCLVCW